MAQKKYVLVINMKARQSKRTLKKIKAEFKRHSSDLFIDEVNNPKKLPEAFTRAQAKKPDVIILGGGDGTIISGIEYLSKDGYTKEIGIIPLGTANYFARNLGISLQIPRSIKTLLNGSAKSVPIGVANNKYFALTIIMGITQAVSDNVSDKLKRSFGQFAYILELIRQTKNHKSFAYIVSSPALSSPLTGRTHQIVVYNSDLNQQIKLVPDHSLEKPTLKLVISRCGNSKFKLYAGFIVHILTLGKLRPYMHVVESDKFVIRTEPALPADYDGEVYNESPFKISLKENAAKIIC